MRSPCELLAAPQSSDKNEFPTDTAFAHVEKACKTSDICHPPSWRENFVLEPIKENVYYLFP